MTVYDASRYWGLRVDQVRRIVDSNLLPLEREEIPNKIRKVIAVDKRFNKIATLNKKHVIMLLIVFIKSGYYFNGKLLQLDDYSYDTYISDLKLNGFIYQYDDYYFDLTDKGIKEFENYKLYDYRLIKSLLGSIKLLGNIYNDILEEI